MFTLESLLRCGKKKSERWRRRPNTPLTGEVIFIYPHVRNTGNKRTTLQDNSYCLFATFQIGIVAIVL